MHSTLMLSTKNMCIEVFKFWQNVLSILIDISMALAIKPTL